jgi:zinc transport system substrate-binding protein
MTKTKYISILIGTILFLIIALFIYPFYNPNSSKSGKLKIVVTIYPIYDTVKNIGREKIDLIQIVPFGQDPHSFEPTPQSMMGIANSRLFIYTGEHIDEWASELADTSDQNRFMRIAEDIQIINNDPHFWQSIENMKIIAKEIAGKLSALDSENSIFYAKNLELYLQKLEGLAENYKNGLKNCQRNSIVVNHDAFQYLARDFKFKTLPVMGISPEAQPSAFALAETVKLVKLNKVTTIFFEELASSSIAETLAKETGAKTSVLSPLDNVQPEKVELGYIHIMEENLKKLQEALICQ